MAASLLADKICGIEGGFACASELVVGGGTSAENLRGKPQ